MTDELTDELATYNANLSQWAEYEGQYVLIHGTQVVGFHEAYEKALRAGYERFGLAPFLVKRVLRQHQAHFVSRMVAPQLGSY